MVRLFRALRQVSLILAKPRRKMNGEKVNTSWSLVKLRSDLEADEDKERKNCHQSGVGPECDSDLLKTFS
jgi:hypothetical protein